MDMARLFRKPHAGCYKPEIPAIPRTLLVVKDQFVVSDLSKRYVHWFIVSPGVVELVGHRFERILFHEDVKIDLTDVDQKNWFKFALARLIPGGEVKKLSRIDTITNIC